MEVGCCRTGLAYVAFFGTRVRGGVLHSGALGRGVVREMAWWR